MAIQNAMPTWITAILRIGASLLGIAEKRQSDNNTPEMKARQKAQSEVDADSMTAGAIEKRDLNELRKESSE